ncbi:MAG: PD-(D/E)XK nuclease family protein [Candidatus Tectomicrobia bacterium]|uniref:PD-(D/E)XK nuclease family protein n=1 Tax=Tectimicrobiota bacterium TaxID=2528274 RepID=A0A932M090_UNCTE|nr:PD-(D/E)XK nuclease family protein [Candidatus Tectomicrobia bacterium]
MRVDNVFHLLNRFGAHEDQISAAFGVILQAHPLALLSLLRFLRIPTVTLHPKDRKQIAVETQVPYAGGVDEQSRIDLQIRLPGRFLVLLESKLGATRLGRNQLDKYAAILQNERGTYDHVRLALVTQFDRKAEAEALAGRLRQRTDLRAGEFCYLRWATVRQLVAETPAPACIRFLSARFLDYVGDIMSNKRIIQDQVIKDMPEVMITSTDPDWWDFAVKERATCQENNTRRRQKGGGGSTTPIRCII